MAGTEVIAIARLLFRAFVTRVSYLEIDAQQISNHSLATRAHAYPPYTSATSSIHNLIEKENKHLISRHGKEHKHLLYMRRERQCEIIFVDENKVSFVY
jgi:hypothetical protein